MNTYLIVSETIYHGKEKLKEITKDISNIVSFNMDENTMDEILQEASYFSMFDDKKCIIVKNAKMFGSSKNGDTNKIKEDSEKLLNYLDNENSNTILIFMYNGKCDSKKKIYNKIKDANNLFLYNSMTKTEMKNELHNIVTKNKYKVDDNTLWYIVNSTLGNFDLCINELNKIMIFYSNPCMIKYEDVVNLTSKNIEDNNFKLVDCIINRDIDTAFKLMNDFKILKIELNVILALVYREFKLMLSVLLYEKNHYNHDEVLKQLKIVDWQYNKIKTNLRKYNMREIKEEIVKLSNFDYKCKSGLLNKDVILINYILDLCE